MKPSFDRRHFAKMVLAGGTLAGSAWADWLKAAEDSPLDDRHLVRLGMNALARAHTMNYFNDGHRGAAMISAHLMCVENGFDKPTMTRISQLVDLNWAETKLCEAFPEEDPDPDAIQKVRLALLDGSEALREVGHNVIFATLAIKSFTIMPEIATPQRVDGVCQMIRKFKPWRDEAPDESVQPPSFSDTAAASRFVLQEASDAIDRFIGHGQGFTGHMLTFGQAMVELAADGDEELAEACRTAFRKYVTVTRQGPGEDARKFNDHAPSKLRPNQAEYWQRRGDKTVGIGHVFKYPYGYYYLLDKANDPDLAKAIDAKAYHVF
ncbi:hypothetical protein C5Y96_11840 [Blastopirellula marina]|uniref:Uncharacterized protein n=1 Tax=Blastopirellula marina TaxID=124 RepID=A0A2S8FGK6_9BACT|nr:MULTISPECIES: hypothetical protein [Pirellulaceae]PQO31044.1 hypothetical protein C5Y96_11840 [Blastopirellula marina]RCS51438.1 hypothetical protein DTL36_11850 [Bremerella cremea]